MHSVLRFPAIALLSVVAPALAISSDTGAQSPAGRSSLQLIDLSPEHSTMVRHAVDLYTEGDLVLPPIVVRGGEPSVGCSGHTGLHHSRGEWSEIDLCLTGIAANDMHTILHELAHAWSAHALQPERKADFQALRGFEAWQQYDELAWEDNGTEQAAEIIAWGLHDEPAAVLRIRDSSCDDLHAGYLALTGIEPLYGLTTLCANRAAMPRA